jgi:hypothetical protein
LRRKPVGHTDDGQAPLLFLNNGTKPDRNRGCRLLRTESSRTFFRRRPVLRRTLAAAAALLLPLTAGCAGVTATEQINAAAESTTKAAPSDALPEQEARQLDDALTDYAAETGSQFSAAIYEKSTGRSWYYNDGGTYLEASLVKVPILLTLLRQATEEERQLTLEEEYLAVMMIEYSDNDATTELYQSVGGAPELSRTYELLGVTETSATEIWGANDTRAGDQLKIARALLEGVDWISGGLQDYAVELMENVEDSQRWGISAGLEESGAEIALKNGWLQDDDLAWNVGSVGFVRAGGSEYAVVVLTAGSASMEDGISAVEEVAGVINAFETTGGTSTGIPGKDTGDTDGSVWRAGGPEA